MSPLRSYAALALFVAALVAPALGCRNPAYPPPTDAARTDAPRRDAPVALDEAPAPDAAPDDEALDDALDDAPEPEDTAATSDLGALDVRTDDARTDAPLDASRTDSPFDAPLEASRTDSTADVRADAPAPDADPRAACPTDMVARPGFCIDRYEAPNERGASPLAMQTATDGERWCAARGRRLCSEAEWVDACRGATARQFPYGTTYVRGRCVDDKTWRSPNWTTLGTWPSGAAMNEARRLYQAEPSGARAGCATDDGVMDLAGNVAEWVTRSFPNANNYAHVMRGCYWAGCYGGAPPSCTFVNPAHPGAFRTYEAGFRCCSSRAP